MRSKRNLARFLALLMALAMFLAVTLMAAVPFAGAPPGALHAVAAPLLLIAAAFLVVCAWALSRDVSPMASNARGAPLAGDAMMNDQVSMKDRRRQWARRYPVGFRSCRFTTKNFDMTEPMTTINTDNCTMNPAGGPRRTEPTISRRAQCNLFAFNANDQGVLSRMATA